MRHVNHILAVGAVHTVEGRRAEATVGAVAHQLGLDHSGASRIVRDATAAGYVTRAESEHDRRRSAPRLTAEGRALVASAHPWQHRTFDELTASWDEHDRRRFAGYLRRLADELAI